MAMMGEKETRLEFDQEGFVMRMVAAGMPELQAMEQARLLAETQNELIREWLVTKSELARTELRLKREIAAMGASVIMRLGTLVLIGFLVMTFAPLLKTWLMEQ